MHTCRRSILSGSLLFSVLLLTTIFVQPLFAQEAGKIDLGNKVVTFAPDLEIPLPLTINSPEGFVSVTVEVGYPAETLKFLNAKPSGSVEAKKGQVKAVEKPAAAGAAEKVVTIEVTSPEPLTLGALATVTFGVTEKTTHGMELVIKNINRTTKTASGEARQTTGTDGKITLPAAIPACFFFMH